MNWIKDTEFVVLNGKHNAAKYQEKYNQAYDCWYEVWKDAYKNELKIDLDLYSDNFTRQDSIGCLFYQNKCVGVVFFNSLNLTLSAHCSDSYFSKWPKEAIKKLTKYGKNILVCSNFTIHFEYRKKVESFKWKDILMGLLVEHFKRTDLSAMTGTMRVIKGMGDCTYKVGAVPLKREVVFNKEDDLVDLVAFYKNSVLDPVEPVKKIFEAHLAEINFEKDSQKEFPSAA